MFNIAPITAKLGNCRLERTEYNRSFFFLLQQFEVAPPSVIGVQCLKQSLTHTHAGFYNLSGHLTCES